VQAACGWSTQGRRQVGPLLRRQSGTPTSICTSSRTQKPLEFIKFASRSNQVLFKSAFPQRNQHKSFQSAPAKLQVAGLKVLNMTIKTGHKENNPISSAIIMK
jgi:hypothetical protein